MGTQEHWTAAQYQEYLRQRAKGNNKYHAVKVEVDGTVYASQSESRRAKELHLLERHGLVRNLREQCRMSLFLPALANTVKSAQWCTRRISFMKYASRTAPGNGW